MIEWIVRDVVLILAVLGIIVLLLALRKAKTQFKDLERRHKVWQGVNFDKCLGSLNTTKALKYEIQKRDTKISELESEISKLKKTRAWLSEVPK